MQFLNDVNKVDVCLGKKFLRKKFFAKLVFTEYIFAILTQKCKIEFRKYVVVIARWRVQYGK